MSSIGEHVSGGLRLRSALTRRCRETPFALLARAPPCPRPPVPGPPANGPEVMEDARLALDAAVAVKTLTRRPLSFLAECMALRSLRGSMEPHSESDPVSDAAAWCC